MLEVPLSIELCSRTHPVSWHIITNWSISRKGTKPSRKKTAKLEGKGGASGSHDEANKNAKADDIVSRSNRKSSRSCGKSARLKWKGLGSRLFTTSHVGNILGAKLVQRWSYGNLMILHVHVTFFLVGHMAWCLYYSIEIGNLCSQANLGRRRYSCNWAWHWRFMWVELLETHIVVESVTEWIWAHLR